MNNYRRYLTDSSWRKLVNKLTPIFHEHMMAEYYRVGGDEHYFDAEAEKTEKDWMEAALEATAAVYGDQSLPQTDEEAAEHLANYEKWSKAKGTDGLKKLYRELRDDQG